MNCEMLGQTLRAESTAVDRMLGVTFDRDRATVSYSDVHAAADRAVAAGRSHPRVGHLHAAFHRPAGVVPATVTKNSQRPRASLVSANASPSHGDRKLAPIAHNMMALRMIRARANRVDHSHTEARAGRSARRPSRTTLARSATSIVDNALRLASVHAMRC